MYFLSNFPCLSLEIKAANAICCVSKQVQLFLPVLRAGSYLPFCCHRLHVSVLAGTPSCGEFSPGSAADFADSGACVMFETPTECSTN